MVSFSKMSGAGNDFVVIDNRRSVIGRRPHAARVLCDRHEGIGADGLLLLENSRRYAYTMRYYNADGTDGGMCGNGARCIAWFAYKNGIAAKAHMIEALGLAYNARILRQERVSIGFPDPGLLHPHWTMKKPSGDISRMSFIDTGSPHAVIRVRSNKRLQIMNVNDIGRKIRHDKSFAPTGTNANFVHVRSLHDLEIRTYERGVEGETQACGTGSIACSLTGAALWGLKSPVRVRTRGGILTVSYATEKDAFTDIHLDGSARITFEGKIDA